MENFKGKAIYCPSGKAGEYSEYAVNFYNGCSAKCGYCYNRKGRFASVLGSDKPTLKKSLNTETEAYTIFHKELQQNIVELKKHGLFFNFVSDPFLLETYKLNLDAIKLCCHYGIPVKILTKQTKYIDEFLSMDEDYKRNIYFGFTLTGFDHLEPGAPSTSRRIDSLRKLHNVGFKTWVSLEPVIDIDVTLDIINNIKKYCDLYKIGLLSGKKFDEKEVYYFVDTVINKLSSFDSKIYFKDSLLIQANINREHLPRNCVTRDFNLHG